MNFIYFILGLSFAFNITLVLYIRLYSKNDDFKKKIYEKVEEKKLIADPFKDL